MPAVAVADSTPAQSAKEAAKSVAVLDELLKSLSLSKSADEAKAAAANIASLLNGPTEEHVVPARYSPLRLDSNPYYTTIESQANRL